MHVRGVDSTIRTSASIVRLDSAEYVSGAIAWRASCAWLLTALGVRGAGLSRPSRTPRSSGGLPGKSRKDQVFEAKARLTTPVRNGEVANHRVAAANRRSGTSVRRGSPIHR